jgi:oxysterol-binding protein-related protein 8
VLTGFHLLSADDEEQAEERFIRVLMYYLSGWHVKPPGVKKPYVSYSPFAAELRTLNVHGTAIILCSENSFDVGMTTIMEQVVIILPSKVRWARAVDTLVDGGWIVSHHPPISAYFYISPANSLRISGEVKPKSRFLGNSVSTVMDGENRVLLTRRPEDGGMYSSAIGI